MKVERKVYITLEVEFDEDVDNPYESIDGAINQGLDKIENWIWDEDYVKAFRFTDIEYK